jgi:Family of unknown function (DUF6082)
MMVVRKLTMARSAHKKYIGNSITFAFLTIALILLVLASPFAVRWIANGGGNWSLLSNVGQTYGFAAALLSGLAFLGIAISIFYQGRQITVSQLQATRTLQLELLKLAYEHPDLQEAWGRSLDAPYLEWRKRTYMNLIFMYLRMGYVMHETTDASLHRTMANRFKTQMGREYWENARLAFSVGAKSRRDRSFFRIVDQEYNKAIQHPPLEEPVESTKQHGASLPLLPFAAGGAAVAAISLLACRRRRSSR